MSKRDGGRRPKHRPCQNGRCVKCGTPILYKDERKRYWNRCINCSYS